LEEETKATQVRFPASMYDRLTKMAKKSRRSLNAEIITCLEAHFAQMEEIATETYIIRGDDLDDLHDKMNAIYEFLKTTPPISIESIGLDVEKFKALSPNDKKRFSDLDNKFMKLNELRENPHQTGLKSPKQETDPNTEAELPKPKK